MARLLLLSTSNSADNSLSDESCGGLLDIVNTMCGGKWYELSNVVLTHCLTMLLICISWDFLLTLMVTKIC